MKIQKSSFIIFSAVIVLLFSCKDEEKDKHKKNDVKENITIKPAENGSEPIEEKTEVAEEIEGKVLEERQSNFLKSLIKEEIGNQKYDHLQTEKSPYSVHFPVEGDSYSVSYSIVQEHDFNNDGIIDYVVNISSEGMLGGNANTNEMYVYYIMKDQINYNEEHTILAYAPFSYNIIDDAKFVKEKFKVNISQNYRTYSSNDVKTASLSLCL